MSHPIQRRAVATRARLLKAAEKIVATDGYAAVRVDQVVKEAGVAKGTFFAHFPDKDALMEIIVSAKINALLDQAVASKPPDNSDALVDRMLPTLRFLTNERYIFDLTIRHSGAVAKANIGPIAQTFGRQIEIFSGWLHQRPFRDDVPPAILAEGIQALATQCMALNFCAINNAQDMESRLATYLKAWLH